MTIDDYLARGIPPEQAARLAGVPYNPPARPLRDAPVDKTELRNMAINLLADLIDQMQTAPEDYRPSEIIAACKEALDRTEGKPAAAPEDRPKPIQININSINSADAYRQLIAGGMSSLPIIDAEPLHDDAPAFLPYGTP
jgi:hypothetical protein